MRSQRLLIFELQYLQLKCYVQSNKLKKGSGFICFVCFLIFCKEMIFYLPEHSFPNKK